MNFGWYDVGGFLFWPPTHLQGHTWDNGCFFVFGGWLGAIAICEWNDEDDDDNII
jgi:hypothetical protein